MAKGNGWLILLRVCIGFVIAGLGSIAIDEVIFKADIDFSVQNLKDSTIARAKADAKERFNQSNDYYALEHNIERAQYGFDSASKAAITEADGTNGTRTRGVGQITRLKDKKAYERKADLNSLTAQKAQFDSERQEEINMAGEKAEKNFQEERFID